jgi:hypothetical protein
VVHLKINELKLHLISSQFSFLLFLRGGCGGDEGDSYVTNQHIKATEKLDWNLKKNNKVSYVVLYYTSRNYTYIN